jgi:hypothetical protein
MGFLVIVLALIVGALLGIFYILNEIGFFEEMRKRNKR